MKFKCSSCGKLHDAAEISFGADCPVQWGLITDEERTNSALGSDQCVIEADGKRHFFVRACLEIPIKRSKGSFTWGVWVSLSQVNFFEMSDHWEDPNRIRLGPYFGWLCTKIPEYPDTMFLKTKVHYRPVGERPLVALEESEHILSLDQRKGISRHRMQDIITKVLHL